MIKNATHYISHSQDGVITDFKEKVGLINSFFVEQCPLLRNESKLPVCLNLFTNKLLPNINFSKFHKYL